MKRIFITFLAIIASISSFSQQLKHIELKDKSEALQLISNPDYQVHYQSDLFVIASTNINETNTTLLDKTPWEKGENYFVVWTDDKTSDSYYSDIENSATVLHKADQYMVISVEDEKTKSLYPATHGGLVKINEQKIIQQQNIKSIKDVILNPVIEGYVAEVVIDSVVDDIIHLENYGTRNCYQPEAFEAQDWIKSVFESYGLSVSLQDFPMSSGNASDNVIAVQQGLVDPNTFVVVGGHYDSYSSPTVAPGADDNASGTSGVMEVARILSQYEFNYTIVYCAFSGEEYGLYGSEAYASDAAANGMNILGYLNLDMIGYLHPGDDYHTDMICPPSAQPLADYYEEIVNTYVEDFAAYPGTLVGGDSDHTSFNENGYMGIFPFEDGSNYSPYIHTSQDTYGLSVNSDELVTRFIKAAVAFVADFAVPFNGFYPPMNLSAIQGENQVDLSWNEPLQSTDFLQYKIYRNNIAIDSIQNLSTTEYTDYTISTGNEYTYYITAQYGGSNPGESSPSNSVVIEFGLMEIFVFDFESGDQGWTLNGTINGWQIAPVNLNGNSTDYVSIDSDAAGSGTHVSDYAISPELELANYHTLKINFDYGYKDYGSDFFKVVYRSSPTSDWVELETLAASTSFINKVIQLPEEVQTNTCQIAMYYDDNDTWAWYAGFDNVKITGYEGTPPPPAPQNLTYQVVDQTVELSWENPAKEISRFYIYRDGSKLDSVDAGNYVYTDENVSIGNTYSYYVAALHTEGESGPSNQVTVTLIGLDDILSKNIKVYPNPANNYINIEIGDDIESISRIHIFNSLGALINKTDNIGIYKTYSLNISDLNTGIYFMAVQTPKGTKEFKFNVVK